MPKKGAPIYARNTQKLLELWYLHDKDFQEPLLEIRRSLSFDKPLDIELKWWFLSDSKVDTYIDENEMEEKKSIVRRKKYELQTASFFNKLPEDRKVELEKKLLYVAISNNLGIEWISCLKKIVLSLYFDPPMFNFSITTDKRSGMFSLVLNPYTTIQDVQNAAKYIEKAKEQFFGKTKRYNFNNKVIRDIEFVKTFDSIAANKYRFFDESEYEYYKPTKEDIAESLCFDLLPNYDEYELDIEKVIRWYEKAKKSLNKRKKA